MTDIATLFVWRRRGAVVAGITGEIDVSNAHELERAIVAELDADAAGLVVDLGGLAFLDAAGVHLLFRLSARAPRFAVVLPDDSAPRRVLELAGPRATRWIHATEDEALAALR